MENHHIFQPKTAVYWGLSSMGNQWTSPEKPPGDVFFLNSWKEKEAGYGYSMIYIYIHKNITYIYIYDMYKYIYMDMDSPLLINPSIHQTRSDGIDLPKFEAK